MSNVVKTPPPLNDPDAWAKWWYYVIGLNVVGQPTKSRDERRFNNWKEWQDKLIPQELFELWIAEGKFRNAEGMAIILGQVWRGDHTGKYFGFIDCDNRKGIVELCAALGYKSLDEMAKEYVVEQHADDPNRAHVYGYFDVPLVGKTSDKSTMDLNR